MEYTCLGSAYKIYFFFTYYFLHIGFNFTMFPGL